MKRSETVLAFNIHTDLGLYVECWTQLSLFRLQSTAFKG